MTTREQLQQATETAVQAFVRETFKCADHTSAAEMQQWIYDHEHDMPYGVRLVIGTAHNMLVANHVYSDMQ